MTKRLKLTGTEKVARATHNLGDEKVSYFSFSTDANAEKEIAMNEASKLEQDANDYVEKFEKYEAELSKSAEDLSQHKNLQIKPISNYVITKPFGVNPFQKITKTAGGITLVDGYNPIVKSNDSGDWEEEERYIFVASVVEVGPECKWLKEGDIIMYTKPSAVPIPFYKLGFELVNETRALCVINDNLNERF